mgnify:CR=1 FL=1
MTDIQKQRFARRLSGWGFALLRFIILFGLAFIILRPIVTKFLLSCMSPSDLLDNSVNTIPRHWSLHYWRTAWNGLELAKTLPNTILLSLSVAALQVASSVLVGYGLARFRFRLNKLLFGCVLLIMLVPIQTISTAQYLGFVYFHLGFTTVNLTNTFTPMWLMAIGCTGIKQGLYVYLFKEQFAAMPQELDEAACIDGAGVWKTFTLVMLPNARTTILTVLLFSISWQWTDDIYSGLYYPNTAILANLLENVSIRINNAYDVTGTLIARCAATLLIMLPLLVLFSFCQKYLTQSISTSGLSNG